MVLILVLLAIGALLSFVANIWLLVQAFRVSLLWGLAYLFLPFAGLVFLVVHWQEARRPFLVGLAGMLVMGAGVAYAMTKGRATAQEILGQYVEQMALLPGPDGAEPLGPESDGPAGEAGPAAPRDEPAGIDPLDPATYAGHTIDELRVALGEPKGILEAKGKILLLYDGVEVESDDGRVVSSARRMEHGPSSPAPAVPGRGGRR